MNDKIETVIIKIRCSLNPTCQNTVTDNRTHTYARFLDIRKPEGVVHPFVSGNIGKIAGTRLCLDRKTPHPEMLRLKEADLISQTVPHFTLDVPAFTIGTYSLEAYLLGHSCQKMAAGK